MPPPRPLRSWDAAEAGLFPLIMARPHEYERSLSWFRSFSAGSGTTARTFPRCSPSRRAARQSSLAPSAGGPVTLGKPGPAVAQTAALTAAALTTVALDQPDLAGLRLDLIAAAACAMRYRELMAARAASRRLDAFASAREGGESWAVIEEAGDEVRAPFLPYQRVEAMSRAAGR